MVAVEEGYDINNVSEWVRVFFSGNKGVSIDAAYNSCCGGGSARKDKIDTRIGIIIDHMTRYMDRIS
jgi:hypothetical protein